jgi:hypothetical protein
MWESRLSGSVRDRRSTVNVREIVLFQSWEAPVYSKMMGIHGVEKGISQKVIGGSGFYCQE